MTPLPMEWIQALLRKLQEMLLQPLLQKLGFHQK
jgi:hypothetical protein